MITIAELFQTIPDRLQPLFADAEYPWQSLDRLTDFIQKNIQPGIRGTVQGNAWIGSNVEIGEGTVVEPGAIIMGPTIIGKNCQVRAGAYIRGNVVTGDNCVIGHVTEAVRSIFLDGVRADHFNYIGDSILGNKVHFGAGAKVANLRFDEKEIVIDNMPTGRSKIGVILGDTCQLGVNVALGPGVIFGPGMWLPSHDQRKSGIYKKV